MPAGVATVKTSALDWRLIGFSFLASLLTGLLFSIAPAVQAARASLRDALQQRARASVGGSGAPPATLSSSLQVAATLVLLVGAGLMLRTLANLNAIDMGFTPDNLLTMQMALPQPKYAEPVRRMAFFDRVVAEVRALPGVHARRLPRRSRFRRPATRGSLPSRAGRFRPAMFPMRSFAPEQATICGRSAPPSRAGCWTIGCDDAPRSVVVNETMVRAVLAEQSVPGADQIRPPGEPCITIVGVVRDVLERGYEQETMPGVYLSVAQAARRPEHPGSGHGRSLDYAPPSNGSSEQSIRSSRSGSCADERDHQSVRRRPPSAHGAAGHVRRARAAHRVARSLRTCWPRRCRHAAERSGSAWRSARQGRP